MLMTRGWTFCMNRRVHNRAVALTHPYGLPYLPAMQDVVRPWSAWSTTTSSASWTRTQASVRPVYRRAGHEHPAVPVGRHEVAVGDPVRGRVGPDVDVHPVLVAVHRPDLHAVEAARLAQPAQHALRD